MNRDQSVQRLLTSQTWDIAIIGGGATGVGIAIDAASRGYSTCLLEQSDFGKGTSSRSTKLIHGGVRYLEQGRISLVIEALHERGILRQNAPHLVHDLPFIVPNYAWWEAPFYGAGLKVYDLLAGRYGFGKSHRLSKSEVLSHIPTLSPTGLRGGTLYYDAQFDDARLLIEMAQTADELGAVLLNYAPVTAITHAPSGFADGLIFLDSESQKSHTLKSRCIINAAGPLADAVRKLDNHDAQPIIAPSQGVHLVLDRSFLPSDAAIMVPHTRDGRILFAIPWLNHTLLGTTDTPIQTTPLDPAAADTEIDFILDTAGKYLARPPTRADILSQFAGIRPLVKSPKKSGATSKLSREHTIEISDSHLLTIAGGKWTTYRKMAQDAVDQAADLANLDQRPCITKTLKIHGHTPPPDPSPPKAHGSAVGIPPPPHPFPTYGSSSPILESLIASDPSLAAHLHPALSIQAVQIIHAARHEMARTVDDILARRTRALFLNARAAVEMAPQTARLLAQELHRDPDWEQAQINSFTTLAQSYIAHDRSQ